MPEAEGGEVDQGETVTEPQVAFRSRRRPRKSRPRISAESSDDEKNEEYASGQKNDEESAVNVALLKSAQRIREQARRMHAKRREPVDPPSAEKRAQPGEVTVGGLRSNFAVESSGYDAQRNMESFIDERMVEKFGPRVLEDREGADHAGNSLFAAERQGRDEEGGREQRAREADDPDADLYALPDHLRVESRPQYDPSEGLPAAGVEEVDIGYDAKRRNVLATVAAYEEVLKKRTGHGGRREAPHVVGNVSANFEQHRRDWINAHAMRGRHEDECQHPKRRPGGDSSKVASAASGDTRGSHANGHRQESRQAGSSQVRGKRPMIAAASDFAVSDRFRKRWRK